MFIPSIIKSIQPILIASVGGTQAINPVDVDAAYVNWLGCISSGNSPLASYTALELTDADTVTNIDLSLGGSAIDTRGEVVEFYSGFIRSIQHGDVVISTPTTSVDYTLPIPVVVAKSIIIPRGMVSPDAAFSNPTPYPTFKLEDVDTLRVRSSGGGNIRVYFTVVEFK